MFDLITIGNVSVDMYFSGDSLTKNGDRFTLAIGGKYMVDHFVTSLGGGAANVAIGAKRAGLSVAIKGVIGDNQFREMTEKYLKSHGIPTSLCRVEKEYQKISSILLSPTGERTVINYETPHEHVLQGKDDMENIIDTKAVYMSNLWRVPLDERKKILSHLHTLGIVTSINLGIRDCRRDLDQIASLLAHADIVIVNTHEFAEMVKTQREQIHFKKSIFTHAPFLKDKLVVVTDGKEGSYAYEQDMVYHSPAHLGGHVVDTTGAGDGYSAGFLASYLVHKDITSAMQAGAKYASSILQKVGAN